MIIFRIFLFTYLCFQVDMKNGTQAIDIMKKTGSIGSSISRMSSQTIASRKPSMLSMLMQKVKSGSHENMRRKSSKPLGMFYFSMSIIMRMRMRSITYSEL